MVMKKTIFISLIGVILFFTACENQEPKTEDTTNFNKMSWLLEVWEGKQGDADIYESWVRKSFRIMEGISTTKQAGTTLFSQSMRIEQNNNVIKMIVTTTDTNDQNTLELESIDDSTIIFKNIQNSYPAKITYIKMGDDQLKVIYSGAGATEPVTELAYTKKPG
jgi:hypothetical protein